jgi:short subunit dehydrogenase-like uncharacterized protein
MDNFTVAEVRASRKPFAISPIPHPAPVPRDSFLTKLTGLRHIANLGLQTTFIAGATDAALVQRTWGLLSQIPSKKGQFYGPNFSFKEYGKTRNWLTGMVTHFGLVLFSFLLLAGRPIRALVERYLPKPGGGPTREDATKDRLEYWGVANPDLPRAPGKQAHAHVRFDGSMYLCKYRELRYSDWQA